MFPTTARRLTGWGRTAPSVAQVLSTRDEELIAKCVAEVAARAADGSSRGVVARGLGRSYGDVAQNGGGLVIDMTALDTIHSHRRPTATLVDRGRGRQPRHPDEGGPALRPVGAGASRHPAGDGRRRDRLRRPRQEPPQRGQLRQPRPSIDLLVADGAMSPTPDGSPDDPDADLFWATVGGIGLTGVILRATIAHDAHRDGLLHRRRDRHQDLDETIAAAHGRLEKNYAYSARPGSTPSRAPPKLGRAALSRGSPGHARRSCRSRSWLPTR